MFCFFFGIVAPSAIYHRGMLKKKEQESSLILLVFLKTRTLFCMIIVLKQQITLEEKDHIHETLVKNSYQVREIVGEEETVLGAVGSGALDIRTVELLPGVARAVPISRPYKLASRELHKEDTVVKVGNVSIGGGRIALFSGPCAVESEEQIMAVARAVRDAGAVVLRGGAFKPRTSPYAFQGLGEEGLKLLRKAGDSVGLPITSEVVDTRSVELVGTYVDIFQIGARNMQNFELLKVVGAQKKPVILKRGLSATIEEWLMAAEYLMAHGTNDVILCERGIRTYEPTTRNTLDLSAIPVVRQLSHLPIIVDPSHATGLREKVAPMALAAVAAGADGIMVEVHNNPDRALSDGPQSLYPEQFQKLVRDIQVLSSVVNKEVERLPLLRGKPRNMVSEPRGQQVTVAFQGVRGAYSESALRRYFGSSAEGVERPTFDDVFDAVLDGSVDYGIIPMENSLAGTVTRNFDLLIRHPDITIIGEQQLRIVHNLIGVPGSSLEQITKVCSHPQGLAQCNPFIRKHGFQEIPFFDTAGAVAHVKETNDPTLGAIAGVGAAETYGMEILQESIEFDPSNFTRFFVIQRKNDQPQEEWNRGVFVFSLPDKAGSLFAAIEVLRNHQVNMKKLESRPIAGKPWEYMFFVEAEIRDYQNYIKAVEEIAKEATYVRVLGGYHSDRK